VLVLKRRTQPLNPMASPVQIHWLVEQASSIAHVAFCDQKFSSFLGATMRHHGWVIGVMKP
jgi:hypothetical protein